MTNFEVTEKIGTDGVKIVVVGIGGKGAGMKPEIGKAAALESYDDIKDMLMKF